MGSSKLSNNNPFTRFAFASSRTQDSSAHTDIRDVICAMSSCAKRVRSDEQISINETTHSCRLTKVIKSELAFEPETKRCQSNRRLELLLELLRARDGMETPIDKFGTQACLAPGVTSIKVKRFQLLVAALLSSQTQDPITYAAMQRLHQLVENDDGLTIDVVLSTSEEKLCGVIKPVGFYKRKAQQLKRVAAILRTQFDQDVPRSLNELLHLPGIGPKIGRLITLLAWGQVDGIVVDTHVHRLAQRLGWASTKTPEDTRQELEDWVPQEYWGKLSLAVVGFGQTICTAKYPSCSKCPLSIKCPSAFKAENLCTGRKEKIR